MRGRGGESKVDADDRRSALVDAGGWGGLWRMEGREEGGRGNLDSLLYRVDPGLCLGVPAPGTAREDANARDAVHYRGK